MTADKSSPPSRAAAAIAGPATPLPWKADYCDICQVRDGGSNLLVIGTMTGGFHNVATADQDAAFTVRAVNSHYDMLEALEALLAEARERGGSLTNGERLGCAAIAKAGAA
jgi:hypothetical protein